MGWKRSDLTPEILAGMSVEDQARYGPGIHPAYEDDPHPPPKTDKLEREEQRQFASWLMLHDLAFCWHATHKRTTANEGVPDFIVGLGRGLWIEFKRVGCNLSEDQEKFRARLAARGITLYVCFSCLEAIELCKPYLT